MPTLPTLREGNTATPVDQRIGDAYHVVNEVHANLAALKQISEGFHDFEVNAQEAITARNEAEEFKDTTETNAEQTALDLVAVGLLKDEATEQAVIATDKAVLTAADRVQTGIDSATAIAALVAVGAGQSLSVTAEPLYVNGQQVMYSVVDSVGRALAYIGMDGVIYGKLPVTASSGVELTRLADGTYTLKLDSAVIDQNYGASDYLAAIVDSVGKQVLTIGMDGKVSAKLGLTVSNGLLIDNPSLGVYDVSLDPAVIDSNFGSTDYLAAVVDSAGKAVLTIGMDGTLTGKITLAEVVSARGNRTDLDTRLSQTMTPYGMPKVYTWGEWFLRETRMRLRKRSLPTPESIQLVIANIGDSWTHNRARYSNPVALTLRDAFGDAGAGWTGFGWGFGGTSDTWSGGNGCVVADMSVVLTANWAVHYNSSVSPDIADIYTSTVGAKVTATFSGSGYCSAVVLYYIAGGSGNLQYRWNGGSWTALDISAGSGLLTASLAGVPTGTWTLEIKNVSGTTTICGIDVQKTTDGVRVHKLGGTGSRTNHWSAADAPQWKAGLTTLAPNLVTVLLGTNDQATLTPDDYRTNLQTLITRIKEALPVADVAIIMPCENQRTNTYAMSLYAAHAYELAVINNCAWLDLQYVFGNNSAEYASGSARPWFNVDTIHPEPLTGGRAIADAVYRLLTTQ